MLNFQIDPHSGVPVYRQIMEQVRYYGACGILKPASQLPSIREMALALSVNPTTIVKAYTELEHEGAIEMRHGKGAFLSNGPQMTESQRRAALRRLARQLAVEAAQMDAAGEMVIEVVKEEMEKVRKAAGDGGVEGATRKRGGR